MKPSTVCESKMRPAKGYPADTLVESQSNRAQEKQQHEKRSKNHIRLITRCTIAHVLPVALELFLNDRSLDRSQQSFFGAVNLDQVDEEGCLQQISCRSDGGTGGVWGRPHFFSNTQFLRGFFSRERGWWRRGRLLNTHSARWHQIYPRIFDGIFFLASSEVSRAERSLLAQRSRARYRHHLMSSLTQLPSISTVPVRRWTTFQPHWIRMEAEPTDENSGRYSSPWFSDKIMPDASARETRGEVSCVLGWLKIR